MKKKFYKKNTKIVDVGESAGKKRKQQLPSNYRTIPEKLNTDKTVFFVGLVIMLFAISLIGLNIYLNFQKQKNLTNEKFRVIREISFWENEVARHSNYRDGYMSLALLNFQVKNFKEARNSLKKIFELDPNFEKGRELEKLLDSL